VHTLYTNARGEVSVTASTQHDNENKTKTQINRLALCVTEDWFALSHFKPLIRALRQVATEVVVITRDSGRAHEIEDLGARVRHFNYDRGSTNPLTTMTTARRLAEIVADEQPDAVHLIALKPIVLGALALRRQRTCPVAVHLTGLGLLAAADTQRARMVRRFALWQLGRLLSAPNSHLFVENTDDLSVARRAATDVAARSTVLGGAGVDPEHFAALPIPTGTPQIAFVGRLVRSKGVDVLMAAVQRLNEAGRPLRIALYGPIDRDNPEAVSEAEIRGWEQAGFATWHGPVRDVRDVWRTSAIFVMAPRGGEGMPRSMLEAAACGRPLIVTDVPGCRHFVRDGIEGLVVAPDQPEPLAQALERLHTDASLRQTMGAAARARVLEGYTELAVERAVVTAWHACLDRR
jgi:glycosyltransferase involved in cell wall biosynthesis